MTWSQKERYFFATWSVVSLALEKQLDPVLEDLVTVDDLLLLLHDVQPFIGHVWILFLRSAQLQGLVEWCVRGDSCWQRQGVRLRALVAYKT